DRHGLPAPCLRGDASGPRLRACKRTPRQTGRFSPAQGFLQRCGLAFEAKREGRPRRARVSFQRETQVEHSEVFVIGAGPAGLTAAYLLTEAGAATTVIEADPVYVGGISRTVNYKDFLFDIGGHRFFSKSKEVVDLWRELLPDDFIERPRLSRIYYDGK